MKKESYEAFVKLLNANKINSYRLSEILGCSQSTAHRKLMQPSKFTLEDIFAILHKTNVRTIELIGAIFNAKTN